MEMLTIPGSNRRESQNIHSLCMHYFSVVKRKDDVNVLFRSNYFRVDIYCASKRDRLHMLNHFRSPTKAIQTPIRVCIDGECVRSSQSAWHWKRYVRACVRCLM